MPTPIPKEMAKRERPPEFDGSDLQWEAYRRMLEGKLTVEELSASLGVGAATMRRWMRQKWWRELEADAQAEAQAVWQRKYLESDGLLISAYRSLLTGGAGKEANAISGLVKLRCEIGENPLLRKPGVTINNVQMVLDQTLDMNKVRGLSEEEMNHIIETGVVPEALKIVNKE